MKTVKKLSVILAAFLLCAMVLAPAAAFADTDTTYTPVTGTNTTFQKALVLNADANVPGITFAYTIEAGAAVAAGNGKMEILSPGTATGVTGTPTIADVTFTAGGAAVSSADGVTPMAGVEYSLRFSINYAMQTYTVSVLDGEECKPLESSDGTSAISVCAS